MFVMKLLGLIGESIVLLGLILAWQFLIGGSLLLSTGLSLLTYAGAYSLYMYKESKKNRDVSPVFYG